MSSAGNQAIAFTLKVLLDNNPGAVEAIKIEIERLDKIWNMSEKEMRRQSISIDEMYEAEQVSNKLKDIIGMKRDDDDDEFEGKPGKGF